MSKIYITQHDYDRLAQLLRNKNPHDDFDKALLAELEKGDIVDAHAVPPDVVTMNSEVQLIDEQGKRLDYWLVFPEDADIASNKVSVLSPVGCALLGYGVGDTVTLHTPRGERKLKVDKIIHQPEREGKFDE